MSAPALAQDDPFADEPADSDPSAAPTPDVAPEPETEPAADAPPAEEAPAEEATPEPPAAELDATLDASASATSEDADATAAVTTTSDITTEPQPASGSQTAPVVAGSHIRRPRLLVDGALIIDSPLRTEVQGREYLLMRRQTGGAALPDTTAALGYGAAGTTRIELRLQPTLVLLNGRRLASAPFMGPSGTDFVDINQIPIQLIERVETTSGHASALYGEGAMGGAVNFVTRRDIEGIDIELGGQATDKFDQGEADVALMMGTGEGKSGANVMLSYFNRQPLAATDRDWIHERTDRTESLLGFPMSFQQLTNIEYPISDPSCDIATGQGHAEGYEVRLRGYGSLGNLYQLTEDQRMRFLTLYDRTRGLMADQNRDGDGDGNPIDPLQAPTYCAVDYTANQDLILKEQRLQGYSTFWHGLSDHTEVFGEFGYYRSDNEQRTAPAFPVLRTHVSVDRDIGLILPDDHADTPLQQHGFAGRGTGAGAAPALLFLVGRTQGTFNGDGVHARRQDALRGVLGIHGDLAGVAPDSILSTWDWELAGGHNTSELMARVNDTLLSNLAEALNSCTGVTIKERQEDGCYNPYYNSVTNSTFWNPLNVQGVNSATAQVSSRGFVTSDSERQNMPGHNIQDGGFICDPDDPNLPCPTDFDRNNDGIFELAGTPNTQQVIDRITGEHFEYQKRTLTTVDAGLRGDLAKLGTDGALGFAAGAQYRRESLMIDYDQAYNEYDYGFLFGGSDLEPVSRDVVSGNVELRLRLLDGLVEFQPAFRVEAYDTVGVGINGLAGLSLRPFATSDADALKYLGLRAHIGYGQQPPTLTQLYGVVNEFTQVDYRAGTQFLTHQVSGNTDLEFENYTTISAGPQWDWAGIHVGADFWHTTIDDMITSDNSRTLVNDCRAQFTSVSRRCPEMIFVLMSEGLHHIESKFENIAKVDTNGVDGTLSYTLDSKRRGLGDFGTFVLAAQGTFINSYLIQGPRVLASYYRDRAPRRANPENFDEASYLAPTFNDDGTRDYETARDGQPLTAEYDAAGYRNYENFAPPMPKLRFSVPLRWMFSGHTLGATMRYVDGYYDDSEYTIEKRNLPGVDEIQYYDGEKIPSTILFDLMYALTFGGDAWSGTASIGVLNLLDTAPPAVESPLGYEVGLHDPRGRTIYARVSGDF
jgi:outer membrane receptor protein involved in Fe transport